MVQEAGQDVQRAELTRLREEIAHLRGVVLEMSSLITERLLEPESVDQLIKKGWIASRPTSARTWNEVMTGDEFIGLVRRYAGDDLGRLMEIGPGYGRLMTTMQRDGVRFNDYLGVDLSAESVKFLTGKFGSERIEYRNEDFFTVDPGRTLDTIISSAVFLHFYPSVEPAMRRCHQLLREGGKLCFDVGRGSGNKYVDAQFKIFVRDYPNPDELRAFADKCGYRSCEVVAEREFRPGGPGWFVCATK